MKAHHAVDVDLQGQFPLLYELRGHLVFLDRILLRQGRYDDACNALALSISEART